MLTHGTMKSIVVDHMAASSVPYQKRCCAPVLQPISSHCWPGVGNLGLGFYARCAKVAVEANLLPGQQMTAVQWANVTAGSDLQIAQAVVTHDALNPGSWGAT